MLVGVDWGTTRLRAALIDADGTVHARSESEDGLMAVAGGGFEAALSRVLARLDAKGVPILMAGMVGSRQGWAEAPYVDAPASLAMLAEALLAVRTTLGDVAIVPGVAMGRAGGRADVMRGEETEVFGAIAALDRRDGRFVLPGTHSKWVTVEDGAIAAFETYMTGDAYQALARHTILSKMLAPDPTDADAFAAGFARGLEEADAIGRPGALLSRLFGLRAEGLFDRLGADEAAGKLSALLIGAEVAAAAGEVRGVALVGASRLTALYRQALEHRGVAVEIAPEGCAARGLAAIAAHRRASRGARSAAS